MLDECAVVVEDQGKTIDSQQDQIESLDETIQAQDELIDLQEDEIKRLYDDNRTGAKVSMGAIIIMLLLLPIGI